MAVLKYPDTKASSGRKFQKASVHHGEEDMAAGREAWQQKQEAGCLHSSTLRKQSEQEVETNHKILGPVPRDPLPHVGLCFLKIPQPFQMCHQLGPSLQIHDPLGRSFTFKQ